MTAPMPPDFLTRKQAQAIKQDSDPAVKLRHLIQCRAYPGAQHTERCLELVDKLVEERDALRARLVSGDPSQPEP